MQAPAPAADLTTDCWEAVCACCPAEDLCRLRCTCKDLAALLAESEVVWTKRLQADFGLRLKVGDPAHTLTKGLGPGSSGSDPAAPPPNPTHPSPPPPCLQLEGSEERMMGVARRVYEAPAAQLVRFQAALVTGGVDADNGCYWADNALRRGADVYCTNCSANADVLALLLDGAVEREDENARLRRYIVQRCCYAAALILNVNQGGARDADAIQSAMAQWSDNRLESFFRELVVALNQVGGREPQGGSLASQPASQPARSRCWGTAFDERRPPRSAITPSLPRPFFLRTTRWGGCSCTTSPTPRCPRRWTASTAWTSTSSTAPPP